MDAVKRMLILALCLFAIPILGLLTSFYVASDYEAQFKQILVPSQMTDAEYVRREINYINVCSEGGALREQSGFSAICKFADEVQLTRTVSLAAFGLGIFIIVFILAAKRISGTNRKRLALVFSPTVRVVLIILAFSILIQAGIFIYSIYTLEVSLIQRVHGVLLFGVGLVAVVGFFQLLKASLGFFKLTPTLLKAKELSRQDNPELFRLVELISEKLKAQTPDHIVVGLEPNFFVTSNEVTLVGVDNIALSGRTLFLSLTLMCILNKKELASVIGHELGHFKGEDTEYSLKFAPIYSKLSTGLFQMQSNSEGSGAIATLPAIAALAFCIEQFASAERTIGRQRELLADQAGAEASSAEALASSLVKISLFTGHWNILTRNHIDILSQGNYYENLAQTFRSICDETYANLNWAEAKNILGQYVQAHPIDTHPPMSERLISLGFPLSDIDATAANPSIEPSTSLIPSAHDLQNEMTMLEIQYLQAVGAVIVPQSA